MKLFSFSSTKFIVCTPPPFLHGEGGGGVNLQPNFQKGGLTGPKPLAGGGRERGGEFKLGSFT